MPNSNKPLIPRLILVGTLVLVVVVLLMWFAWPEIGVVGLVATIAKSALITLLVIGLAAFGESMSLHLSF